MVQPWLQGWVHGWYHPRAMGGSWGGGMGGTTRSPPVTPGVIPWYRHGWTRGGFTPHMPAKRASPSPGETRSTGQRTGMSWKGTLGREFTMRARGAPWKHIRYRRYNYVQLRSKTPLYRVNSRASNDRKRLWGRSPPSTEIYATDSAPAICLPKAAGRIVDRRLSSVEFMG